MLFRSGTGFWASKILLSAVRFQLFTRLATDKKMSAVSIKNWLNLKCTDRNVYDYLDALTALGFLEREGLLETALYSNSMNTEFFLDKNKTTYIGGMLEMLNNRLYQFWGNLEEGLLTGQPQNEARQGQNLFAELYSSPQRLNEFVNAMSGIQMGNFIAFAQKFDFSKYKTLTDAGGSSGLLSVLVAKHQPHMQCISFDLPPVEPIANKTIALFELTQRVQTATGDFFNDPIPPADVIVMGNILHDWDEEHKIALMMNAFHSLPDRKSVV